METLAVDARIPDTAALAQTLARAAEILHAGGLVAFPTETVYGLGANALDAGAINRLFAAKGRPAHNPVIVHVATIEQARGLVSAWNEQAQRLAEHFWPGPLTLVLPRGQHIPDEVTAHGPTVALRLPSHPVAAALLRACNLPIAAPSANRSSTLSPTQAAHVQHSFRDCPEVIDLIIDGGPTAGGLESTVLDVTTTPATLLRPGLVTVAELEACLGPIMRPDRFNALEEKRPGKEPLRSPGLLKRHYAPQTPLEVVAGTGHDRVVELRRAGLRVGWLRRAPAEKIADPGIVQHVLPDDPAQYGAQLFAVLHSLDALELDHLVVSAPPNDEAWLAVNDRLGRAATPAE